MIPNAVSKDRLPALDLLRFFAAVGVLAYHYLSSYLPFESLGSLLQSATLITRYGYLGVELFFMISGFVILWSAQGRTPTAFVVSRISRLYPTFWVAMLLTSAFLLLVTPHLPGMAIPEIDLKRLLANATMLPGMLNAERIDGVYWTLELEIRFYFLVFVLLMLRQMRNAEWWIYAWLVICCIAALYIVPWLIGFLSLMPYGPFFIAGSLLYIIYSSGWSKVRGGALLITLTLCVILSLEVRSSFITPDVISAWVVPLTVVGFFAAFLILIRFPRVIRQSRLTYRLGALTYPLYLTHAAIGGLVLKYMVPRIGVCAALLVATITAFVIAQALVVLVDEPARKPMARACNRAIAPFVAAVSSLGARK